VVAIDHNPRSGDPFGGMMYQEGLEQHIFDYGDGSQSAPAQRITDFVEGKISTSLSKSSYIPGIYPGELHQLLPQYIVEKIRRSLKIFDRRMRGYYTEEAQFVGLESRTDACGFRSFFSRWRGSRVRRWYIKCCIGWRKTSRSGIKVLGPSGRIAFTFMLKILEKWDGLPYICHPLRDTLRD